MWFIPWIEGWGRALGLPRLAFIYFGHEEKCTLGAPGFFLLLFFVFSNFHYICLLGSHNKIPQAVAYTTEMYCLIVVGAGSPRSRCWQHWFLLWSPWFAGDRLPALPSRGFSSASLIPEWTSLKVHISFSYKDTSQIGLGHTLMALF